MSAEEMIVTKCPACGEAMDVTSMPPFSRVSCPACGEKIRVKCEFGPYLLDHRLATGGMSVLFVARDTLLDREVAVKILNEDYSADEVRISAFEEEARVTASLSHPNIVRVLTTGRAFGRFFIAMELVPGGHFEHHIRTEGKIPEARMLRLAIQIANGLKAAHEANLIHRDIKPGNILLDAEGNAKIVDFGLALVTQGGTARANEFWATPYYVPPETIEGADEDFRSDIYAFGATLYHALAGKPPCNEENMATDVLRAAKKNIVPLHIAEPGLPQAVCEIVDKAMAYEPGQRYASYDELLDDLHAAANHTKHGVPRETAGQATNRRSQARRSRRFTLAAAGLLVIIAAIGALAWLVGRGDAPPPAPDTVQTDPPAAEPSPEDESVDLGQLHEDAREALTRRSFAAAFHHFARLHANPKVLEPTRTWAGVQAVVAAMLDEDPVRAGELSSHVRDHVSEVASGDPEIATTLLPLLARIEAVEPVVFPGGEPPDSGAAALIAWLLTAIHAWQTGNHPDAVPYFQAALDIKLDDRAQWAAIYQEVARDHLADAALLDDPACHQPDPADQEAAEALVTRLETLRGEVRTRGPIAEILRLKINEINRIRRQFAQETDLEPEPPEVESTPPQGWVADPFAFQPPVEDPAEDPPAVERVDLNQVRGLLANYEFSDARRAMRRLDEADIESRQRNVWIALARSAEAFMQSLREDVAAGIIPINGLRLKSDETLTGVRPHPDGSPRDGSGDPVRWADIHPDSYIDWHRARVRTITDESERTSAHESALAFDLLVGDRWRAMTAIERLGENDENFALYWKLILDNLPK